VDYRGLNRITIKNRYPLPLIQESLDRLKSARYFSKLDLRGAYNLIRINPGEEWKTAFRTRYGLFEYLVMLFGLCNAPATFQAMINDVLREYLDVRVIIYLHDILVYLTTREQHVIDVRNILQRRQQHRLWAKLEKCKFFQDTVEFLGYIITRDGIKMDDKKIKSVLDWPTPKTVRDVQAFLGFANFYRRFIRLYSKITSPITRLLRKDTPFDWNDKCDTAFKTLKTAFTTPLSLRISRLKNLLSLKPTLQTSPLERSSHIRQGKPKVASSNRIPLKETDGSRAQLRNIRQGNARYRGSS
jgi:hypothetical protein